MDEAWEDVQLEIVGVGDEGLGRWYNIPGVALPAVIERDDRIGSVMEEVELSEAFAAVTESMVIEDRFGEPHYFAARPPCVFIIEQGFVDRLRERRRGGEDSELLMAEVYANGKVTVVQP